MIQPFAKQTNEYLQNMLQIVQHLYLEEQCDITQLNKLQNSMPPNNSSIRELIHTEEMGANQLITVQQIIQQIQQQLQQEYDPNAISKWD